MLKPHVVAMLLLSIAAAGCSAEPSASARRSTPQVTSSTSPSPEAKDEEAKAEGPKSLGGTYSMKNDLGDTYSATALAWRKLSVSPDMRQYIKPKTGHLFMGAQVRWCSTKDVGERTKVGWAPWFLTLADETVVEAASPGPGWFQVPLYPQDRTVREGKCVQGWVAFEVPRTVKADALTYAPDGAEAVDWSVS